MADAFKVIIIGGGPAGLTAAHSLYLAGIDFVVLERRDDVSVDSGASLVLAPPSLRVMQQFGIFHDIRNIGAELQHTKVFTIDGTVIKDNEAIQYMKKNHGSAPVALHRAELIQTLYDGLPSEAKEKYFTGKKLESIRSHEHGVEVTCADGSVFEGSIVLGADGVHSKTRKLMRQLALKDKPNADWDPEDPYSCTYRCLWCSFPRPSAPGEGFETQHKDQSIMYLTGKERGWIFLYEKIPNPSKGRVNYTDEDVEAFQERFKDFPITDELKVKDVWKNKLTAGMSNLEEGIVKRWSFGRVVLAGDACHKFTPNAGLGFNNGIQDVVSLCNGLNKLAEEAAGGQPSLAALSGLFDKYQTARIKELQGDFTRSAQMTRTHAWASTAHRILSKHFLSYGLVDYILLNYLAPRSMKSRLVLDYAPAEEPLKGLVEWTYPIPAPGGKARAACKMEA